MFASTAKPFNNLRVADEVNLAQAPNLGTTAQTLSSGEYFGCLTVGIRSQTPDGMKGRGFSDHMKTPDDDNRPAADEGQGRKEETRSAFKATLSRLDEVKTKLRAVIAQLDQGVGMLKTAQREQHLSAREIQIVRDKLRQIQRLEL